VITSWDALKKSIEVRLTTRSQLREVRSSTQDTALGRDVVTKDVQVEVHPIKTSHFIS